MASEEKDTKNAEDKEEETEESLGASMSSWFSGWYDVAKKKLSETNEFMKHDLQEFSLAVQEDASRLVAATATTMKEKLNINVDLDEASSATRTVKDSLSNILGNIANKVGPIRPDDGENADESAIVGTSSGAKVLSPAEARLYAIRTDPATFCNEPDNENEFYAWLPNFNVENKKEEISTLMLDVSQIRSLYTKLVPSAVSHSDFWARYFFKVHQHDKAEERRAMLVERAHKAHDDIEWDDEDDDWVQPKSIAADGKMEKTEMTTDVMCSLEHPKPEESEISKLIPSVSASTKAIKEEFPTKISAENLVTTDKTDRSAETVLSDPTKDSTSAQVETEMKASNVKVEPPSGNGEGTQPTDNKKTASSEQKQDETKTSNNKTPSSGESSDDWEKDFDLDMTEDEIQQALMESDAVDVNVDDIGEDWDDWE